MSPLNNPYDQYTEPVLWKLGVQGRKTGIQPPSINERDQYNMEPLGAFFSSPDRAALAASRNGDPESNQDDGNGRAEADYAGKEIGNEPDPFLFREPSAHMDFAEPSPLQLQPILPAQIQSAIAYPSSPPERNDAAQNDPGGYDTEGYANAEAFSPELSGNEDSEEGIECQDSQHGHTSADTLQHLKEAPTNHSQTSSQQSKDVEPGRPTSPCTIQNYDEDTTGTLLQQTSRGIAPPQRRGRPNNTTPGQSKGPEADFNSQKRRFETLSSASPDLSSDESRLEEADYARERKKPRKTATRVPNTPHSAQANPALAQGPQPKERPVGRPKKRIKFSGKCTRQRKVKTVVRPGGHTYTTRSGRVCNTPVHDWRGDTVAREYESVPDATGRGQIVLPTITKVIRAPTEGDSSTGGQRGGNHRKSARKKSQSITNTKREPWEEIGIISVNCKVWQADREADNSDVNGSVYTNRRQVAFTSEAILSTHPAKRNFQFGRIDTPTPMSFGILHLPSGQRKEAKNTRGSEQVFFLHSGKVCVELEQQSFRISKGSSWIVPRGNEYSIINDYDKDAHMFFCCNSET
ncbi:hypothetical protein CEP54_015378 [Fusarium duplospermum]|uniref:Mif2/CENP-C cupin domain-containing protein n=1 Tax=Fusarium duplospermum TaxID=1325734 RepID=A0A428NPR9_9HYPO|nr:hypothetical protein CEP54_015378 [Fusarium duplospermum]